MYAFHERHERALHLLDQVDLAEHAYKLPSAVSGGQQQRAAIAAPGQRSPHHRSRRANGNLDSKTADSIF